MLNGVGKYSSNTGVFIVFWENGKEVKDRVLVAYNLWNNKLDVHVLLNVVRENIA